MGDFASKELITRALHALSAFKNPTIVLLNVIEVPSRTATLETDPYKPQIAKAEQQLQDLVKWLTGQGLDGRSKVVIARRASEGIIEETRNDDYLVVFMMKRRRLGRLERFFARSVSEEVIRDVDCLVMTAPLEYERSPKR